MTADKCENCGHQACRECSFVDGCCRCPMDVFPSHEWGPAT